MTEAKQCPVCGDVDVFQADYCTCGHAFGADAESDDGLSPMELTAANSPSAALRGAVVLLRVMAVIFALGAFASLVVLMGEDVSLWAVTAHLIGAAVQCFLLWIGGDVIRILVEIRQGQNP